MYNQLLKDMMEQTIKSNTDNKTSKIKQCDKKQHKNHIKKQGKGRWIT